MRQMQCCYATGDKARLHFIENQWTPYNHQIGADKRGTPLCSTIQDLATSLTQNNYSTQTTHSRAHSSKTNIIRQDMLELESCAKGHLEGLVCEITSLAEHSRPPTTHSSQSTCWSTNTEDVNVALTVIKAAGASINDGVTRFNLVYKSSPGKAASESMAKEMGGFCQQMVSSLTLLSSVGASKAMAAYFSAGVRAVLHTFKDVVEALLDPSRHAHLNSLTGMVWQACKELQRAPKTNKLACRRQMMQWSVAVKDTISEFHEAAMTTAAANAANGEVSDSHREGAPHTDGLEENFGGLGLDSEEPGALDDFDLDDMDNDYSPSELRCVEASVDILRVFRRCLKAANDSLNTLDSAEESEGDSADTKDNDWLKRRLEWGGALQTCLDEANDCAGELGILLYPPLSCSDLSGRADDLERSLAAFCDVFGGSEEGGAVGDGGGSEQSPLRTAVEEKMGVLRAELLRL